MERKKFKATMNEAKAMLKYWSNFAYSNDELAKTAALSELHSWQERVEKVREVIKDEGLWYLCQEPMVILLPIAMIFVNFGIVAIIASRSGWLADFVCTFIYPIELLALILAIPAGYLLACAIDMLVCWLCVVDCDDVISDIDRCKKQLL